jgi:hypothetical protein
VKKFETSKKETSSNMRSADAYIYRGRDLARTSMFSGTSVVHQWILSWVCAYDLLVYSFNASVVVG